MRCHHCLVALAVAVFSFSGLAQDAPPIPSSLMEAAAQAGTIEPGRPDPVVPEAPPPPAPPTPTPPPAPELTEVAAVGEWTIVTVQSPRRRPDGQETTEACGYERDVSVSRVTPAATTPAVLVVACERGADGLPTAAAPTLRLPSAFTAPITPPDAALEVGVQGGLVVADIVAVLKPLQGTIAECHARNSGVAGSLTMRLVVGMDGLVTEAAGSEGALLGTPVEGCVTDVLRTATFAVPSDGHPAVVSAKFTFQGRPAGGPPIVAAAAAAPLRPCAAGEKPTITEGHPTCQAPPPSHPCQQGEQAKKSSQLAPGEVPCTEMDSERGVPFLKGELTSMGDVQLVNSRTSFGVGFGINVIDNVYFGVIRPDVNLQFGDFELGLGAPLRFELADLRNVDIFAGDPLGDATANLGRFRIEDWDQLEDFVRPLRYVSWGKKEDNLYVDLNRVHAITIGHGQLMRRYAPNLDIDEDNLFAQADGYGQFGGVELMAGPFPLPRLVGGLVFIKPLGILNAISPVAKDDSYLRTLTSTWSIGFSYVTDLNSPTGLEGRQNPVDQRSQLTVDATNQLVWRNRINPVGDVVQGIGVDTEVKVLKTGPVDIKLYGDYSHLLFPGDSSTAAAFGPFSGGGFTLGSLMRVSLGETPVRPIEKEDEATRLGQKPREKKAAHAFRLRLEGRTFAPTYLPSYWNTMYEVDRFQFGFNDDRVSLPTKIRYLADLQDEAWRVGYYTEVSYAWVDVLGVTAAFEDAYPTSGTAPVRAKNIALHVESKGLGWLQFFGTYHFRNFEAGDFNRIFGFNTDNEILFVGGRLQVLPILFINVGAQRAFRVVFSPDDVQVPNSKGERFTSIGLGNAWTTGADIELGWQF